LFGANGPDETEVREKLKELRQQAEERGAALAWSRLGSGSVRGYFYDEVCVEGAADPFQQRNGGHDAACFQGGQRGLGHASPGRQFGLGQAQGQAAFSDGLADQEGAAGLEAATAPR
jgi:hypothetical protein